MYKHLFGPVPSRRLGMSLGIDLIPHKICTLDCIYCECGATTKLTTRRKEYVLYDRVIEELDHYLKNNPEPDYITFSGSGEPTLHNRIGEIIGYIKLTFPTIPVAVLTNGTLFNDPVVRSEIAQADLVLPSLDAAGKKAFQKMNRPDDKLDIKDYINGLVAFREEFKGEIWMEVMIIPGYNDHREELILLKEALQRINPDRIQLNSLDRPGAVEDIAPATRESLQGIIDFWQLDNVEIIASVPDRKDIKSYREDVESAILETIARRPCTLDDLHKILGIHENEINKYLGVLEEAGKIEVFHQARGAFYRLSD
jgi:wyosine [tRNA(Phe)-imidazoG37] synthetase (radical SAM superfamily)